MMMKKLFTILLITFSLFVQAQDREKRIILNYGVGSGELVTFWHMVGANPSIGKSLTNLGLNYSYTLKNKNWHLDIGLNYLQFKHTSTPGHLSPYPQVAQNYTAKIISIPIKFRYEAGKYIFFNGNLYLDREIKSTYTVGISGLGAGLGMGGQYFFNDKLGIYVNPQLDLRSIVSFSSYKLLAKSVDFGLAYKIN